MPNVGLEDESPSSKGEDTPDEEVGESETVSAANGDSSPVHQTDVTDAQHSPHHQSFGNGERRRRKLPEIPKNRKCKFDFICKHNIMLLYLCARRENVYIYKCNGALATDSVIILCVT